MNQAIAAALAAAFSLVIEPTAGYTLELLPGEFKGTWKDAMAWAKEQGGELPTRIEQIHLFNDKAARAQFKDDWYWSSEPHADDASYAWCQGFSWGGQLTYGKDGKLRARAVRRVPIQPLEKA